MDTLLFLGYAVVHAGLLAWGLNLAARRGRWAPADLPLLVVAGLVYDNLLIGTGRWIGAGPLLEVLNTGRFWIHVTVTPVLVAWALHALRRAGFAWAAARWFQVASIALVVALAALEYVTEVRGLRLVAQEEYGVVSYTNAAGGDGPPLMVLVVVLVLIVVGAMVWRRQGWPWLLVGALVMTIGSAVDPPVASGAVTNAFELVLLVSVLATTAFQDETGERRSDQE